MTQMKLDALKFDWRNVSAARLVASTIGALVGLFGMEHGFFEILQGNVVPTEAPLDLELNALGFGYIIDAIGPDHKFWPGASEPAFTIIPNFLLTGILAVLVGFLVLIWAIGFIHKKYGAGIFMFLCVVLLLVGGGSPPLVNGVLATLAATKIDKPLSWWRTHLSENTRNLLAKLWPWSIIVSVALSLFGVEMAIFGYPLYWFFTVDQMTILLLLVGQPITGLMVLSIITAFVFDIQNQTGSHQT
ncbi:MAG: hypothetical protein ACFFDI_06780 [Promethearchaeota archaeon]